MRLFGRLLAPKDCGLSVVHCEGNRIAAVEPTSTAPRDAIGDREAWILPGLIDAQVNGAFGQDFSDPSADVALVCRRLPEFGVTSFVPTIITSPAESYGPCLENLRAPSVPGSARILGAHIEGPFLSPGNPGTHNRAWLRSPDVTEALGWVAHGNVRIVTLAPELAGADDLIRRLVAAGVIISLGHSNASWAEAAAGVACGASYGTHLFNAMPPLHHRAPGLAGFLLASHLPVGVIGDGVHLSVETLQLIARVKSPDEVILITDALAGLGMPVGRYELAGTEFISDGIVGRLPDGTLSGSLLPLTGALRNVINAGVPPEIALRFVTANPARLLGLGGSVGRVDVGATADLVVVDSEWNVTATVIDGSLAYCRDDSRAATSGDHVAARVEIPREV